MKDAKQEIKFKGKNMRKRGLSGVVTTVLLVMLSIAAISILYAFIIPMIKENTHKAEVCFNSRDYIRIEDGKYTCYDSTSTRIMIARGENENIELNGIIISLLSGGSSERYEIRENSEVSGVEMYTGGSVLVLPDEGGAKTYLFNIAAESVSVAGILNNDLICDSVTEKLNRCLEN